MAETKKAERLPNKFEACLSVLVLLGLMVANSVLEWGNDPHLYITDLSYSRRLFSYRQYACFAQS